MRLDFSAYQQRISQNTDYRHLVRDCSCQNKYVPNAVIVGFGVLGKEICAACVKQSFEHNPYDGHKVEAREHRLGYQDYGPTHNQIKY